jgi:hypothetical protein
MNSRILKSAKPIISGSIAIVAAWTSYRFGHLAAYHFWLAGGPPVPNPVEHAKRAEMFGWSAIGFLIVTLLALWVFARAVRQT